MSKEVLPESHKLFKETFQQSWDEISKDVRTKIAKRFFNGDNMKPADLLLKRALLALNGCSPSDAFNLRQDIRAFLAAEPEAEPTKIEIEEERHDIDWQSNEGAVYLFAGWLTTRDKVISCGRTENASPMAEAIKEYKAEWPERFTKPTEPEAEPVAWIFKVGDVLAGQPVVFEKTTTGKDFAFTPPHYDIRPLFLHPPRPEPARKPLNGDQILEGWESMGVFQMQDFRFRCFTEGVRWAERMHGIGGDDE